MPYEEYDRAEDEGPWIALGKILIYLGLSFLTATLVILFTTEGHPGKKLVVVGFLGISAVFVVLGLIIRRCSRPTSSKRTSDSA